MIGRTAYKEEKWQDWSFMDIGVQRPRDCGELSSSSTVFPSGRQQIIDGGLPLLFKSFLGRALQQFTWLSLLLHLSKKCMMETEHVCGCLLCVESVGGVGWASHHLGWCRAGVHSSSEVTAEEAANDNISRNIVFTCSQ